MGKLSDLQCVQLDLLREFVSICEREKLRYYLVEGSMLGAVRHKGFIPWDDDIDVAMPRADYNIFLKKAKELSKPYKLTTFMDHEHYWMTAILWNTDVKVLMTNATESIEKFAWIDVIPLDGMPDGKFSQKLHYMHFYYYRALFQASNFSKIVNVNRPRPFYERFFIKLFQIFPLEKMLDSRRIGMRMHRIMSKYDFDKSNFVIQMISDYKMKELVPREWFGEGRTFQFENLKVSGVLNAEAYLSQIYGEYMKMPPQEKRIGKHSITLIKKG